jgi:hypothetical protein
LETEQQLQHKDKQCDERNKEFDKIVEQTQSVEQILEKLTADRRQSQ